MSSFGPLVSAAWLAEHRAEVRIVDTRWYLDGRSGHDAYLAGHLPGAVWLDIDADLSGPATAEDGRHPLPAPEVFAAALSRVGIAAGQPVVVYDDAGGSIAARLWWLLHVLDEPVAVLDGGIAAWLDETDETEALSLEVPHVDAVPRLVQPWPSDRFADADAVAAHTGLVIDARAAHRYLEGDPAIDPRPGHIPGAVNRPWAGNLDPDSGRFLDRPRLGERFGLTSDADVIVYCGSGITACHDLLALELAGATRTALYPGSWSQWAADLFRPTETHEPDRSDPAS